MTTLDKHLLKSTDRSRIFYGINLRSRYHTIAHLCLREVECILEDLHLLTDLLIMSGVIDTALNEVIKINLRKLMSIDILIDADTHQTE